MSRATSREIDVDLFRERILDVAEEHFRRIGYQKTSVADIAFCLGIDNAWIIISCLYYFWYYSVSGRGDLSGGGVKFF